MIEVIGSFPHRAAGLVAINPYVSRHFPADQRNQRLTEIAAKLRQTTPGKARFHGFEATDVSHFANGRVIESALNRGWKPRPCFGAQEAFVVDLRARWFGGGVTTLSDDPEGLIVHR